jgi:hypothetical protein
MRKIFLFTFFVISTVITGQTITGIVKNAANQPIVNALVCQAGNPSIFIKTDATGKYTLSGTSSTAIRVGALGYKTIKSTVLRNITMEVDPLLSTDVFHISFDNARSGASYSKDEFSSDFNTASGAGFADGVNPANDRASVDYGFSRDPGGVSLKVKYPKDGLSTSESGVDARIPLTKTYRDNDFQSKDLYVSYWIRLSDDYEFNLCGGKLPSLGGSVPNTRDSDKRWKGRIMMRKGGGIQFYMELPGDDKFSPDNNGRFWGSKVTNTTSEDICDFEYTNYLRAPIWHNIELHYRFETPGKSDGIFEGWVDGTNYDFMNASVFNGYLLVDPTTLPNPTDRSDITINTFLLSTFLGGSSAEYTPSKDLYAWFDEIRVSKTRINDWNNYNSLSVDDFQITKKLEIHPIPSKGIFNLNEDVQWKVYDILGNNIANGNGRVIDIQGKSKGIYFVKSDKNTYNKIILE